MIRLGDLFEDIQGYQASKFKITEDKINHDDIPYLRPSSNINNLIVGYVSVNQLVGVKIAKPNSILVSTNGQGSHSYSYVIPFSFITSNNACYLEEKKELSLEEKMFYAKAITQNRYKFSYGRLPVGNRLRNIVIPSPDEIPSWVHEVEIPDYSEVAKPYLDEPTPELNVEEWKEFRLDELFEITRGRRITKRYISENTGIIPVIAGGEQNQGILGYMSESLKDEFVFMDKCITVSAFGSTGSVLFHDYSCYIDDKAIALQLRKGLPDNTFIMLFLTTLLQQEKYRYNYGRGVLVDRYKMHDIKLPATLEGNPDWEWMEKYMKTLGWSREVK